LLLKEASSSNGAADGADADADANSNATTMRWVESGSLRATASLVRRCGDLRATRTPLQQNLHQLPNSLLPFLLPAAPLPAIKVARRCISID